MVILGESIAFYREKAGLTQEDLAKKLGNTRVTITGWEGKKQVTVDENQLETLKKVLNVNTDDLTNVPRGTQEVDILDHPVIKSLVSQSKYILKRVEDLERENKDLRDRLGGSGA